jgi:hypothetical protein
MASPVRIHPNPHAEGVSQDHDKLKHLKLTDPEIEGVLRLARTGKLEKLFDDDLISKLCKGILSQLRQINVNPVNLDFAFETLVKLLPLVKDPKHDEDKIKLFDFFYKNCKEASERSHLSKKTHETAYKGCEALLKTELSANVRESIAKSLPFIANHTDLSLDDQKMIANVIKAEVGVSAAADAVFSQCLILPHIVGAIKEDILKAFFALATNTELTEDQRLAHFAKLLDLLDKTDLEAPRRFLLGAQNKELAQMVVTMISDGAIDLELKKKIITRVCNEATKNGKLKEGKEAVLGAVIPLLYLENLQKHVEHCLFGRLSALDEESPLAAFLRGAKRSWEARPKEEQKTASEPAPS